MNGIPDVTKQDYDNMTEDEKRALIARLTGENAQLKAKAAKAATRRVSLKVSEKGGVSLYGLGRFPVTLYKSQWGTLLALAEDIREFIRENDAQLAEKPATS